MVIDCDTCVMDGTDVCADCIVPFLLGETGVLRLDDEEASAIRNLADVGLLAPIRLVPRDDARGSAAG
jgi:hypothetical protein